MLKIQNKSILLTRGDSAVINLTITDKDGNVYSPKSTDTILFTVKKDTKTSAYIFQKTINDGTITINPSDTESLDYGDFVYDVQIKMANGYTDTFIPPSLFRVCEEVTF